LEPLSFEAALDAEDSRLAEHTRTLSEHPEVRIPKEYCRFSYVLRGLYAEQLERWLEHFPEERVLVICSEDFFRNPAQVYSRLTSFLGISPWSPSKFLNYSYTGSPRRPDSRHAFLPATRERLEQRFREPNERLYDLLGRRFDW
jgi:hypothetical protein